MQSRASIRDEDRTRSTLAIFHDRATSRVADVASVILRDITAWMLAEHLGGLGRDKVGLHTDSRSAWRQFGRDTSERGLLDYAMESGWGAL
jgi:hypothetical protein